jgi:hypothetical protein
MRDDRSDDTRCAGRNKFGRGRGSCASLHGAGSAGVTKLGVGHAFPADEVAHDRTAPFRLSIACWLSLGSLRVGVKADAALPVPRVPTAFDGLRFDTADDVETLEFDLDEGGVGGSGDRW